LLLLEVVQKQQDGVTVHQGFILCV